MNSITPEVIKFNSFPRWISRGSTLITQQGVQVDMANLPPDTCKIERAWMQALRSWSEQKVDFISEEDVNNATIAFKSKEKSCEYCKRRRFVGFTRLKRLAADRKRRASMPEQWKRLNKYTRKLYFIEVDWDQDWISNQFKLISLAKLVLFQNHSPFQG